MHRFFLKGWAVFLKRAHPFFLLPVKYFIGPIQEVCLLPDLIT